MRRPLLAVCICIVAVIAYRIWAGGTGPDPGVWEGSGTVTVTGKVYRKDFDYFYLDDVKINSVVFDSEKNNSEKNDSVKFDSLDLTISAASSQQIIPFNLQCEHIVKTPKIGSCVTIQGIFMPFSKASNPGEFDAAAYYSTLDLGGRVKEITLIRESEDYCSWRENLYCLRKYFRDRLYDIFPGKEASIMSAMLLGDKSELDSGIKNLYQENGIIHILSISGLHITLIGMSVYRLLRRIGLANWTAAFAGGGLLLLYGIMTGMSISASRAIGMFLIRMLAEIVGRTYDMLTAVGIMAVWLVATEPLNLKNAGFLLSFGAIAGIGVLQPALAVGMDAGSREKRYEERRFLRVLKGVLGDSLEGIRQSFFAGLSVTLMTLPVLLWFYYEVPVYSVLLNILILPFMAVLLLTGLTALLIPGAGIIGTASCIILAEIEALSSLFGELPFSVWNPGRPQMWQIGVYYGVMAAVLVCSRKSTQWQKQAGFRYIRYLKWVVLLGTVGIFAIQIAPKDRITFLDVGQGDCICIELATGEVYLFDCGSTSRSKVGEYVLKPFLKYSGISHVDGVFVSHGDKDHYSGIEELLDHGEDWNISVGQLVLSGESYEGWPECFGDFITVEAGDFLEVGEVRIRCLHPSVESGKKGQSQDTNEGSQCFYVDFGEEIDLLLTGDVEAEGEKHLLEALKKQGISDIALLKVSHHGSRNGSSEKLLELLAPQVSVISCGRDNRYGHPHEEVLERLEKVGSLILTTPEWGAIMVEADKGEMEVWGFAK